MIKVEKLLDGGAGYVYKYGDKVPLLPGLLMDDEQYLTAVIEAGSVLFSIHESELVTKTYQPPVIPPAPQIESPVPAPNPDAPQIVWPTKKR